MTIAFHVADLDASGGNAVKERDRTVTIKRIAAAVAVAGSMGAGILGVGGVASVPPTLMGSGVANAEPNVPPAIPPPWAPVQPNPPWWAPGASVVWSPAIDRWGFWWFGNFMPM